MMHGKFQWHLEPLRPTLESSSNNLALSSSTFTILISLAHEPWVELPSSDYSESSEVLSTAAT